MMITERGSVIDAIFKISDFDRDGAKQTLKGLHKFLKQHFVASGNIIKFKLPKKLSGRNGKGLSDSHYGEEFEITISIKIEQIIEVKNV